MYEMTNDIRWIGLKTICCKHASLNSIEILQLTFTFSTMKRLLFTVLIVLPAFAYAQKKSALPAIGVVQSLDNATMLKEHGYAHIVESVGKIISPRSVTEEQFGENLIRVKQSPLPVYAFNIFIPGSLKVVGPDVNEKAVLAYVDSVLQRCKAAGVDKIIWGSGGSRRVPEGFDHGKAKEQFISIARKIAARAEAHQVKLALENLNSTETNFINTIEEALDVVKKVNHKNLRLCVDVYHMLKENEGPAIIAKTKGYVIYCEVAEKNGRTPPGVQGDKFAPYFAELKKIGYDGEIMIECRWDDVTSQAGPAIEYLRKEIREGFQ
jgi:sugar phosphate isomerase/epimerase